MTRRDLVLVLGIGFASGLAPACTHTGSERNLAGHLDVAPAPIVKISAVHAIPEESESSAEFAQTAAPQASTAIVVQVPRDSRTGVDLLPKAGTTTPKVAVQETDVAVPADLVRDRNVEARLIEKPAKESALLAALRCYLDKRPADAIEILRRYDKGSQEMLLCLLPLCSSLAEGERTMPSAEETALTVDRIGSLLLPLQAKAALVIDKICFCRKIEAFGTYDPLPEDHLYRPGEMIRVYLELRNFTSEKREIVPGRTLFVTQLASGAEIRDSSGKPVWSQSFQRDKPDRSLTLRRDYFDHYRFCLPEIPPGSYTLWIWVTDTSKQRLEKSTARRSLDFHVTTAPARGS